MCISFSYCKSLGMFSKVKKKNLTLCSGLCPGNPALLDLRKSSVASRSHSMRDQTAHMREKYQVL